MLQQAKPGAKVGASPLICVFSGPNQEQTVTPDGISTADWDRVNELALEVVNTSTAEDHEGNERAKRRLKSLLDDLQEKYGPLPSLLATRADYVDRPEDQEYWLLAAYDEAVRRDDAKTSLGSPSR